MTSEKMYVETIIVFSTINNRIRDSSKPTGKIINRSIYKYTIGFNLLEVNVCLSVVEIYGSASTNNTSTSPGREFEKYVHTSKKNTRILIV